ncbi:protein lifeguard 1 [Drosophila kikkawai]|uniref:Protein lifeguard 1 n=1 Tax=Drosophila kikkawai TaxID=30033 RepID=A0A6P4ILT0_DROKI|nr:protein lifeguard 1 [Drosophila kikkawai]
MQAVGADPVSGPNCIPLRQYPPYGSSIESADGEGQGPKGLDFNNDSIRRGFVRKVYLILLGQLMCTLGLLALLTCDSDVKLYVAESRVMFLLAWVGMLVILGVLTCNEGARRKAPTNFIFLGAFTLGQSFLVSVMACRYAPKEIFMAVVITAVICLGLTVFAMQTTFDFTMMGGMLVSFLLVLVLFGFVSVFTNSSMISKLFVCLGALVFSFYLVFDTQMMVGGKHRYSISPEEYIFAALNLYMDVVNIFLNFVQMIGGSDG